MKRLMPLAAVAALGLGLGATALAQGGADDPYLQAEPDVTESQMFRLPGSAPRCDDARSVTVRITPPVGAVLGSVRVLVDNRQAARLTGVPRAASATVRVPKSGARVTVAAETLGGQRLRSSRVYADCTRPPEPTSPPDSVGVGEG
jgi:hypothetical protein